MNPIHSGYRVELTLFNHPPISVTLRSMDGSPLGSAIRHFLEIQDQSPDVKQYRLYDIWKDSDHAGSVEYTTPTPNNRIKTTWNHLRKLV